MDVHYETCANYSYYTLRIMSSHAGIEMYTGYKVAYISHIYYLVVISSVYT